MRRYLVRELHQVTGHARHRGDDRYNVRALALCVDKPTCDFTYARRRPDRSAAIFLNHHAHVRERLNPTKHEQRWFSSVGYSPIACRTAFTVAGTGFNSFIAWVIASGSFKPWPVTVQTIRLASGMF